MLRVDALKVSNCLLGQLEVTLNLPLLLFNVALCLLLTFKSVLALIEGLLELSLDLVEGGAPVLCGLDILLRLLPSLAGCLLLLARLDNHILLVGNFIPEGADLGVLGVLVILALVNGVLNGGSTGCKGKNKLVLLGGELGVDLNHGAAVSHGLVDVGLSDGNLLLVLLLVLSKLGALKVGFDRKPKLEPEPGL